MVIRVCVLLASCSRTKSINRKWKERSGTKNELLWMFITVDGEEWKISFGSEGWFQFIDLVREHEDVEITLQLTMYGEAEVAKESTSRWSFLSN